MPAFRPTFQSTDLDMDEYVGQSFTVKGYYAYSDLPYLVKMENGVLTRTTHDEILSPDAPTEVLLIGSKYAQTVQDLMTSGAEFPVSGDPLVSFEQVIAVEDFSRI